MNARDETDGRDVRGSITAQRVPLFMVAVLGIVFIISFTWEFFLEGSVLTLFGADNAEESGREHWRYIITVTAFTAIALVPPTWLLRRAVIRRERMEAEIRHLASHDGLTGLPNRRLFMDRLDQAIHRAHRDGKQAALLFMDLDDFKSINDSLGHPQGDAVLKLMADRLASCMRQTDTVARFGGDEFVIVMTDVTDLADVTAMAEKLNRALAEPCHLDGGETSLYASIGIALYPDHATDRNTLLAIADDAMYQAKGQGKGRHFSADVAG